MMKKLPNHDETAELLNFIDQSPTPFHAAENLQRKLLAAGFREYQESEAWNLRPGSAGFVVRNQSALAVFRLGNVVQPEQTGFRIVAAHTDSPALKLKWQAGQTVSGCLRIPVEVYGGTIHSSWLDRPLGVAGRIYNLDSADAAPELVCSRQALAVIPNIAPHLNREINEGFRYNPQQHLAALFGRGGITDLFACLLQTKKCPAPDSLAAELFLYDASPASLTGLGRDLILAPRLDNLVSCFAATTALCNVPAAAQVQILFLADNEEVGSVSMQGASSSFLRDFLSRLLPPRKAKDELLLRMLARSMLLSADAAHAAHANFPEAHDPAYCPELNRGIVIKNNASLRYATNAVSQAVLLRQCRRAGIPVQFFAARSDKGCGSTIGPACSALLGVQGIDLGIPLLGMHSCRETAGAADPLFLQNTFETFWKE